jgi:hypothetical protein
VKTSTTNDRGEIVNGHLLLTGSDTVIFLPHRDRFGPNRIAFQSAEIKISNEAITVLGYINTGDRDSEGRELFIRVEKAFYLPSTKD